MLRSNRSFTHRVAVLLVLTSTALVVPAGCEDIHVTTGTPLEVPVYGLPPDGVIDPNVIPDEYIVMMQRGSKPAERMAVEVDVALEGATVLGRYDFSAFQGFWVHIPPPVLEHVRRIPEIAWLETNRFGERTGLQTCPPWNLDMLDHQSQPATMLDQVYSYARTGDKIRVLVVDTGLGAGEFNHMEDALTVFPKMCKSADQDGHGTMVAEVVAGKTNGVAKNAIVMGYNIEARACHNDTGNSAVCDPLPGCGTACDPRCYDYLLKKCKIFCSIMSCPLGQPELAFDIAALGDISEKIGSVPKPVVVVFPHAFRETMPIQSTLEQAVAGIVAGGGIFITGAGNTTFDPVAQVNQNACDVSPARLSIDHTVTDRMITVGGLSSDGSVDLFNSGPCVDLFAPGAGVQTTHPGSKKQDGTVCVGVGKTIVSGTSFAAAHVAGVAALLLGDPEHPVGLDGFKQSLLQQATRTMNVTGGLPGSPNLVLHSPYNIGESGTIDEDTGADKTKLCEGPDCLMCDPANGTNPCNPDDAQCTERIRCTGEECARCGQEGDRCCSIGSACDGGIDCLSGYCACGQKGQKCCNGSPQEKCAPDLICGANGNCADCGADGQDCCPNGSNGPCDNDELVCSNGKCVGSCVTTCCDGQKEILDIPDLAGGQPDKDKCIREGGDGCWSHNGPTEIRHRGEVIWDKNPQCHSLYDAYTVCCDGTYIPLKPQFDEDIATQIAKEECNKGPDSKMRATYMGNQIVSGIFPDTCGACNVLCCDGTEVGADYSWPGVGPQDACKFFGGSACRDHGYGPSRIQYGDQIIWSKGADACPTNYRCMATCKDGNNKESKVFVGDMFDESICDLIAGTMNACGSAVLVEAHLVKGCGGPGDPCCSDYSCVGDMVCDTSEPVPTCRGRCSARCVDGQFVRYEKNDSMLDLVSKQACINWAGTYCADKGWGMPARVRYNYGYVYDLDSPDLFPGTCGQHNKYCCIAPLDSEESPSKCQGIYTCQADPTPPGAITKHTCRLPPP